MKKERRRKISKDEKEKKKQKKKAEDLLTGIIFHKIGFNGDLSTASRPPSGPR